jgi:hypothetical protein
VPTDLITWGERGLVSTLLADLASCENLEIWRCFFEECLHGGNSLPPCDVESALAVVEPDFANTGFGHPDAVFKLTFQDNSSHVFIVEAKRNRYVSSSILPAHRACEGYNSQLNGQLIVRSRPQDVQIGRPAFVLDRTSQVWREHERMLIQRR